MKYATADFEFTRAVQPANYETTKATGKLSVVFEDDETPDIDRVMQDLSERVQAHVLSAVGKQPEDAGLAQRVVGDGPKAQPAPEPPKAQGGNEQPAPANSGRNADDISDNDLTAAAKNKAQADGSPEPVKQIVKDLGLNRMTEAQGETRAALYEKLIGER